MGLYILICNGFSNIFRNIPFQVLLSAPSANQFDPKSVSFSNSMKVSSPLDTQVASDKLKVLGFEILDIKVMVI